MKYRQNIVNVVLAGGSSKSMDNLSYRVMLSTKRLRTFLLKKSEQQNSDGLRRLCD